MATRARSLRASSTFLLAHNLAVRLVAFDERDPGYIDNVLGSRTFATSMVTITNANMVKNNFNPAELSMAGGRPCAGMSTTTGA